MLVMQRPTVEALGEESNNQQRFEIGPLEPGFGHTLGNSLRRTLLSSIPGAAITTVRFDEALHEFDTISGVAEDVTDIILNLKDVVLTSEAEDAVNLRVDVPFFDVDKHRFDCQIGMRKNLGEVNEFVKQIQQTTPLRALAAIDDRPILLFPLYQPLAGDDRFDDQHLMVFHQAAHFISNGRQ